MLILCCPQMFDSSKDELQNFSLNNSKLSFCHTRLALIGGHVGHVGGYNCHVLFLKMDLTYWILCFVSFIDQFKSFWSSLVLKWLQENPVLHVFNDCMVAILKFKMVDKVQKVGCCQFWKISVEFSLHHANIDIYIEKCIMLQWDSILSSYIDLWPFIVYFHPC